MKDNHSFTRKKVEELLEKCKDKTLGDIDYKGIFDNYKKTKLQKGIAGKIIEECVFGYEPNNNPEPDLIIDGVSTELKTTGIIKDKENNYVAKEPVSITAVSIYNISNEVFQTSHFWLKLENMLFVFYEYRKKNTKTTPYDYKDFYYKGHCFNRIVEDKDMFQSDWEKVHTTILDITRQYETIEDEKERNGSIKKEYINKRREIREKGLNYIDLAPKYPPRFRLKKSYVSYIYNKCFTKSQIEIIDNVKTLDDLDVKCRELEKKYCGKTLETIAKELGEDISQRGAKNIAETVITKMFTNKRCKLNKIELFIKFGVIAKTCVYKSNKSHSLTEDTKLFKIDFDEIKKRKVEYYNEDNELYEKKYEFEDSDFYEYFSNNHFLFIILDEPASSDNNNSIISLKDNIFKGFRRVVFNNKFVDEYVKKLWEDTRNKIINKNLKDVTTIKKGKAVYLSNGDKSSSPNFIKSKENPLFIRGSATKSTRKYKTEEVNGIKMLPQYVWIHKKELKEILENNEQI